MNTATDTTPCYCRHISTIKPADYSDLPVVSTKNVSGLAHSLAITHHERKNYRRSLGEMQSQHVYNHVIDITRRVRVYGNLSLQVCDCDHSHYHENAVSIKVELICEYKGEWQWRIDEYINTSEYAFMRQEDVNDEDLWYFIAGKMFNEIYDAIVKSYGPNEAKTMINNTIAYLRNVIDTKVSNYLELTHWNHDKNCEGKKWRANDIYHWNQHGQFMTYTDDNNRLRED